MTPNWHDAPEWATHAAMDENGLWYWYQGEPRCSDTMGKWYRMPSTPFSEPIHGTGPRHWSMSLESRPDTRPASPEDRRDGEAMDVFNRAARDLPEGWIVAVHLEKDSGGIELTDPDGTIIGTDYCSLSIDSQIDAAVRVAIDAAQADHEGV